MGDIAAAPRMKPATAASLLFIMEQGDITYFHFTSDGTVEYSEKLL